MDSAKVFPACSAGPLPLVLRKFSVTQMSNENLVKWVTENATQIEGFEVERSTDGLNFFSIDKQQAINASGTHEYRFSDNSFTPGTNYYRLKMVDLDGKFTYSSVVLIRANNIKIPMVYPNPAGSYVNISAGTELVNHVSIYDFTGKAMIRVNNKGSENILHISTGNLSKGVYQVEMTTSTHVCVEKLLIE